MSSKRKLFAVLVAITVALGALTVGGAGSVQAAPGDVLGPLKVNPLTGNQDSLIDFSTLSGQKCPVGTGSVQVLMTGGIMTDDNPGILNGNTDYSQAQGAHDNLFVSAGRTMKAVFVEVGIAAPGGTYRLHLQCLDSNLQSTGEFAIDTTWTTTAGANNGNYVAASTATTTSTVLSAGTPDPVTSGTATALTATVTPSNAVGTITFKNGATNLAAPITVAGGTATLDSTVLPAGTNSLSALFTPTDVNAFKPSTGTRSYVVAGPTSITGTARVGATLTCAATTGGTKTYAWFRNGVQAGYTTASLVAPAAWLNAPVTCRVTSTKSPTSVARTSAARTVTIGAAPVVRTRPKVLGITRVGRLLTCSPGTWSPAATSYRYQWFRGAVKIAGKTARTYRTVRVDKNKLISCRVTAVRTGHLSGVSKSPARKVT